MSRKKLGDEGERMGSEILAREGYRVLQEKYRCPHGEIDLVGTEGEILAFVEVKARRRGNYGTPAEAVDRRKRSHLITAARYYLYKNGVTDRQCRFDVLSIYMDEGGGLIRYELFRDAFQVRGGNYF